MVDAASKMKINRLAKREPEIDDRTPKEYVLDSWANLADQFNWEMQNSDEYDLLIIKDKYSVAMGFDDEGSLTECFLRVDLHNDAALAKAIREF
jgi:hypothetical protein